jgi:hypothetical protein
LSACQNAYFPPYGTCNLNAPREEYFSHRTHNKLTRKIDKLFYNGVVRFVLFMTRFVCRGKVNVDCCSYFKAPRQKYKFMFYIFLPWCQWFCNGAAPQLNDSSGNIDFSIISYPCLIVKYFSRTNMERLAKYLWMSTYSITSLLLCTGYCQAMVIRIHLYGFYLYGFYLFLSLWFLFSVERTDGMPFQLMFSWIRIVILLWWHGSF